MSDLSDSSQEVAPTRTSERIQSLDDGLRPMITMEK